MDDTGIGKTAISDDAPAGIDCRYEPLFEELQAEIDKLGSPSATGGINWSRAATLAEDILTKESKDLLVASYYSVAHIHTDGIPGLGTGFQLFTELLETFWDTMFPKKKRMRGRVAAVEWWVEKSESALEQLNLQAIDATLQETLLADCRQLSTLVQELFPDPPSINGLCRIIEAIPVNAVPNTPEPETVVEPTPPEPVAETEIEQPPEPAPTPTPEPPKPAAPTSPPPPPAEPVPQHPVGSTDEAVKAIQSLHEGIKRAALVLVEHDLTNPLGHRALRTALWADIESLPQAVENKTLIPAPEPHILSILQDLAASGDWYNLVVAAETHFADYIFWVDLQRYAAMGLEQLGRPYEMAHDAVCQETATFLNRMGSITNLQFADGQPFADEATQEWCQNLGGGSGGMELGTGLGGGDEGASEETALLQGAIQKTEELIKEKKLTAAVTLLQKGLQEAHSARQAMQWRLLLVQTLISGKKAEIGLAHCEKLFAEAHYYRLEQWEPEQALRIYTTFYHCLKKCSSKLFKERGQEILEKIAALDSAEAIQISS